MRYDEAVKAVLAAAMAVLAIGSVRPARTG